jgi:energy-converting hydrogenase Eha subunit F
LHHPESCASRGGDIREAVQVNFTAGYGATAESVPGGIRTAILTMVAGLYESRESSIVGMSVEDNPLVQALLAPHQWDIR